MNSVISITSSTSTPSSPIPSDSWSRSAIPSPTPSQRTGDSHRGDTLHHFKATQQRTLSNSSLINTATTQECIDATVVGPLALSATKPTHVLAVDGKLIWRDDADSLLALHVGSSMDVDALQDGELLWVAGYAFRAMWVEQQLVLARLLGFACPDWTLSIDDATDTDPFMDKIGGSPIWLPDASAPARPSHPICSECKQMMFLLTQVQTAGALPSGTPNASLDRVVYVFGCNKAACSKAGSFKVFRCIKPHASKKDSSASSNKKDDSTRTTTDLKPALKTFASATSAIPTTKNPPQPQNPPKFSIKDSFSTFGDPAIVEPATKTTKKKGSMFAQSSTGGFGFGGDADAAVDDFSGFASFGGSKTTVEPVASKSDPFGGSSGADDEISRLLQKRDATYSAWMDDGEKEPVEKAPKPKSGKKKSQQQAAVAAVQNEPQQQQQHFNQHPRFPGFVIEFLQLDSKAAAGAVERDLSHEMELLALYQKSENVDVKALLEQALEFEGSGGGKKKGSAADGVEFDVYEKTQVKGMTKAFKTFQKAIEAYPEQCVRYGFGSDPLLFNDKPISKPDVCVHCNSPRIFEMQLMPALLTFLPTEEFALKQQVKDAAENAAPRKSVADLNKGLDFGTILVYTCSRNCVGKDDGAGGVRLLEEVAIMRADDF
ncbi:programmed cell death protein [Chytriomyces hyalinus]|nr:programmed cell death protein [Chytriomyces hyalinus]